VLYFYLTFRRNHVWKYLLVGNSSPKNEQVKIQMSLRVRAQEFSTKTQ